jgi:hypothetical protein
VSAPNGTDPADGDRSYEWCLEQVRAAVARCRAEHSIDDSGADSGSLGEDEERDRSEWPR